MKTKLKLFLQETGYTCTCACARMLLDSKGIEMSELEIEKSMKIDQFKGGSAFQLIKFLKEHGIESELIENSSISELKKDDSIKMLIFKLWGKIPHIAIIKETLEDGIILFDPAIGETHLKFKELEKQWSADDIECGFIKLNNY